MTGSVTRSTQAFFLTHSAVAASLTAGIVVLVALLALVLAQELLRASPSTVRRRLAIFTAVTVPLELIFVVTVIERFAGLA